MPIQFSGENGGKILTVHVSGKPVKADYTKCVPEFERLLPLQVAKPAAPRQNQ